MKFLKKALLAAIPGKVKDAIIFEYKVAAFNANHGHHQISYAQQGEDLAILRFFDFSAEPGFYVDIGAFHPVNLSNTHLLYQRGWRGINIEPNPDAIALFKLIRPQDTNLNIAIADTVQELTYYQFNFPALNTFAREHAEFWAAKDGFEIVQTQNIKTYRLDEVLTHYGNEKSIDLLTVDAEGFDLKILQSNNWTLFRPKLIVAEVAVNSHECMAQSELISYLDGQHYNIWSICNGSILFRDNRRI